MVDFLVGGITLADRNNLKASVEDAVLNCRSAARNGVGYGANFMALRELNQEKDKGNENPMFNILYNAYYKLIYKLYSKSYKNADTIIDISIKENCPLNIRTGKNDGKVLSSIKSDIIILEAIEKILSLMFTCNQYLIQTPNHNIYSIDDEN